MTSGIVDVGIVILLILLVSEWSPSVAGWLLLVVGLLLFAKATPYMTGGTNAGS